MRNVIDYGKYRVLEGDSSFPEPDIKIQKELYALTPSEPFRRGQCRVLDIGAYIGDSTRYYLDCGAEVSAIEAYPDAFQCLLHNCPEAVCMNLIVGDGKTKVMLNDQTDNTYQHHTDNYGTRGVELEGVSNEEVDPHEYIVSVAIDELGLGQFDLIKIDVEGFEWAVMEGLQQTLRESRPTIIIEVFDSMLAKFGRGRADVLKWVPERYQIKVGVGRWEDDRCDLICTPL